MDPRPDIHDSMADDLRRIVESCCSETGLEFAFDKYWEKPYVDFDKSCIQSVKNVDPLRIHLDGDYFWRFTRRL